jgi:hypothetical protein
MDTIALDQVTYDYVTSRLGYPVGVSVLWRPAISIQLAALSERFHVLQRLHEPRAPSFLVRRPRRFVRQHRVVEKQSVDDL